jgi:phosphoglycerate kinase
MSYRSVRDADVSGKRVMVRVDFNVPMQNGEITDDTRIRAALPTIEDVLQHGAAVILVSHLGRPKGKRNPAFSLAPVAKRLGDLLARTVKTVDDVAGELAKAAAASLAPGDVLLLENVRFEAGEEKNDPELAKSLAALADVYVNDAFGAAHRAHASTVGVAELLPSYAGYLMQGELDALQRLVANPDRPYIAILGGAKVSDKLAVIDNLSAKVDAILVGGGMANTFLLAQGLGIGKSLAEPDFVEQARSILDDAKKRQVDILLPVDVVVASSIDASEGQTIGVADVGDDQAIFDIGPETAKRYAERISAAKTIFWNGPMGVFEHSPFAAGTLAVARAVAASGGFSVVGGGDSVAAIEQAGVTDQISHVSTGGGASLEYVEGRELPGVAALEASAGRTV